MQNQFKEMLEKMYGRKSSAACKCQEAGECEDCEFSDMCEAYDDEEFEMPDFLEDATNVYRTEMYIVKQRLNFNRMGKFGVQTLSADTYYERTPERDDIFDELFGDTLFPDGRRLPAMAYVRTYKQ